MNQQPLGVYVHLPFCRVRCTYCAFAVTTRKSLEDSYFDALLREIGEGSGQPADSLFLGGGTPSNTTPENAGRLLGALRQRYDWCPGAEFTIEANPEDVTQANLDLWRELGITRLSIGIQSLHDEELRPLGRVHGREGALAALASAVTSGLRTSADLILGLPRQTVDSFAASLRGVIDAGVGHLSLYVLDLEEGSALSRQVSSGRVALPLEELTEAMYLHATEEASRHHFEHYEVSNFARPGEASIHNLKYWQRLPYRGYGVSAHSFLGSRRFSNARSVEEYIGRMESAGAAIDFEEDLTAEEIRHEQLLLGLRRIPGLDYAELVRLCGKEGLSWAEQGLSEGWLRREGSTVCFTARGFLLSNEFISRLF